ncbi:MAG: uracil-DNA glycosylase [Halieaceae bacterium]
MTVPDIQLEPSWLAALADQFSQPYMQSLKQFLQEQKSAGKLVYPPGQEIFAAFDHTPLEQLRVVILGQDPYHGPGQAHGLCFSVRPGVALPPSLVNIFREIEQDLGINMPTQGGQGCLTSWADQGVLLLNSVLSVERAQAASHRGKGWEQFTDRAIEIVNQQCEHVVFMLWGAYAQRKGAVIDAQRHCVLRAPHPSPLSAHRGFFGCGHFSAANRYLEQQGYSAIDWRLPVQAESSSSSA